MKKIVPDENDRVVGEFVRLLGDVEKETGEGGGGGGGGRGRGRGGEGGRVGVGVVGAGACVFGGVDLRKRKKMKRK